MYCIRLNFRSTRICPSAAAAKRKTQAKGTPGANFGQRIQIAAMLMPPGDAECAIASSRRGTLRWREKLQESRRFRLDGLQLVIVINLNNVSQVLAPSALWRGTFATSSLLPGPYRCRGVSER